MPLVLKTARLYLRQATEIDMQRFHALHTDPFVVKAVYDGKPPSWEDTYAKFKKSLAGWRTYGYGHFAVFARQKIHSGGGFLGERGLDLSADTGDLELSGFFHETASGHEYAPEAGCAILHFAFETLGAPRVLCFVRPENQRSMNSVCKMGFRQIGDRTFGGALRHCFEVRLEDLQRAIAANPRFAPLQRSCPLSIKDS